MATPAAPTGQTEGQNAGEDSEGVVDVWPKGSTSFGIGCFHFRVRDSPPYEFRPIEYPDKLRRTLEAIPNIDNVEVDIDADSGPVVEPIRVTEQEPRLAEANGYFPQFYNGRARFEIQIPYRIQAELLKTDPENLGTQTQRFRVFIRHEYEMPVTLVESVEPSEINVPAEGVRLVRDFLEREVNRLGPEHLGFECLGPTPMHVQCYIRPRNDFPKKSQGSIRCNRSKRVSAYDLVIFDFDDSTFPNLAAARDRIFNRIADELDLFYDIAQSSQRRLLRWAGIDTQLRNLMHLHHTSGLRGMLGRAFLSARRLDDAFVAIAMYESDVLFDDHEVKRKVDDLYDRLEEPYFKPDLEGELRETYVAPVKPMTSVIELFNARRNKRFDALALIVASILGGIVGSVLTALATRGSHP